MVKFIIGSSSFSGEPSRDEMHVEEVKLERLKSLERIKAETSAHRNEIEGHMTPGENSTEEAIELNNIKAKELEWNKLLINEFKDYKPGDKITIRTTDGKYYFYEKMFFDQLTFVDGQPVLLGFDHDYDRKGVFEKGEQISLRLDKNTRNNLGLVDVLPGFLTDEEFEKALGFNPAIEEDKYLVNK